MLSTSFNSDHVEILACGNRSMLKYVESTWLYLNIIEIFQFHGISDLLKAILKLRDSRDI